MLRMIVSLISTYFPTDQEEGQGLVEYALILVLVSVAAVVILGTLSGSIDGAFQGVVDALGGGEAATEE